MRTSSLQARRKERTTYLCPSRLGTHDMLKQAALFAGSDVIRYICDFWKVADPVLVKHAPAGIAIDSLVPPVASTVKQRTD